MQGLILIKILKRFQTGQVFVIIVTSDVPWLSICSTFFYGNSHSDLVLICVGQINGILIPCKITGQSSAHILI